jgi:hypothetical protein
MNKLTPQQAGKLTEVVRPMGGYQFRLQARTETTNLNLREPWLYQLVTAAYYARHGHWVELHYLSCWQGVARPPTDK